MKFRIYTTAYWSKNEVGELLAKYPILGNYKLKQTKEGVVITITSLKALVQLSKDVGSELIIGNGDTLNVKDSIEIYDDWR